MADRPATPVAQGRSMVQALNGMVCTSQPLAAQAGLRMLQQGGSAADAAVAAAAVLAVVEPNQTGIGGDMFALAWAAAEQRLLGLNGAGAAPAAANIEAYRRRGYSEMPERGLLSATLPGAVKGWEALLQRLGRLGWEAVLAPAIEYAEQGFPVSDIIAAQWRRSQGLLAANSDTAQVYLLGGHPPHSGEVFRNPALGATLRAIAALGADGFYRGAVAGQIAAYCKSHGGLFTEADLAAVSAEWVEPVRSDYRGVTLAELPPPNQGIAALQMLNVLESFDIAHLGFGSDSYLHALIEAKKLAFADRDAYYADPRFAAVPVAELVSKEYALRRRRQIDPQRAMDLPGPGLELGGDTTYLCAADRDGNCVSFINSVFKNFGSGIVPGNVGFVLHNRGWLFTLDPRHPNALAPGKRPFHTIMPGMLLQGGKPLVVFGVMGADIQPQGHAQVVCNLVDFNMDVQAAGEAPRVRHFAGPGSGAVALESGIGVQARLGLMERGHVLQDSLDQFGGYQAIRIDAHTGVLQGGSDPRKDGCAVGW